MTRAEIERAGLDVFYICRKKGLWNPMQFFDAIEEIFDDISSGHFSNGRAQWMNSFNALPKNDWHYRRIRSIALNELDKRLDGYIEMVSKKG
jgi:hypothetical protein